MIGVAYTGTDGSSWDLRRGPVQITRGGLQGLGFPPMTEYTDSPALLNGQTFSGQAPNFCRPSIASWMTLPSSLSCEPSRQRAL